MRWRLCGAVIGGLGGLLMTPLLAHATTSAFYNAYTGYADVRNDGGFFPAPFPDTSGNLPPNTTLYGNAGVASLADPDISAVRIDNTSPIPIVVNDVTVTCSNTAFDLGGPGVTSPLASGATLIVVGNTTLDGSDGCVGPVNVQVTVDGIAATYPDNQVTNQAATGTNGFHSAIIGGLSSSDESVQWTLIGAVTPPASTPESPFGAGLLAVAGIAAAAAVAAIRRRS